MSKNVNFYRVHFERSQELAHCILNQKDIHLDPNNIWDQMRSSGITYLSSKEGMGLLKQFTPLLSSLYAERLIKKSIAIPSHIRLNADHIQLSVVSALLYPLRQVVGSCFATAPAIFIQRDHPEQLLIDLYELLMKGRLTRVYGGKEYLIPMSLKWGDREYDHSLLRAWEYTLASFSDHKTMFSKWNLWKSLGLDCQEQGGIGDFLFQEVQQLLDLQNQVVDTLHDEYVRAVDQARVSESLLRQADSHDRIRRRKTELQVRSHHASMCRDERDDAHKNTQGLSQLFKLIINHYQEQFEQHFLELYDPDLHQELGPIYEDTPAGFRLCYKHGRTDPSSWTMINNYSEFINALRQFFISVEPTMLSDCEEDLLVTHIQTLTTRLLHFIQSDDFSAFALNRDKTPWSYISGGNVQILLKGYFCIEGEISERKSQIKDPQDLLTFLLDTLKALPYRVMKTFEEFPTRHLLMYSPTHVFLLQPGLNMFMKGWLDKGFTYTWIRDEVITPLKEHFESIMLDEDKQRELAQSLVNQPFYPHFKIASIKNFREDFCSLYPQYSHLMDSLLFKTFATHPPLVFADSNWSNYWLCFTVNPSTLELDLYRMSIDGSHMYPMHEWREYLDGSNPGLWGVFTSPNDFFGARLDDLALKLRKV